MCWTYESLVQLLALHSIEKVVAILVISTKYHLPFSHEKMKHLPKASNPCSRADLR